MVFLMHNCLIKPFATTLPYLAFDFLDPRIPYENANDQSHWHLLYTRRSKNAGGSGIRWCTVLLCHSTCKIDLVESMMARSLNSDLAQLLGVFLPYSFSLCIDLLRCTSFFLNNQQHPLSVDANLVYG